MQWKIELMDLMIQSTLHQLHAMFGHQGSWHMQAMLQARYHHMHLCMHMEKIVCNKCQHAKLNGSGHGLLPDCNIVGAPWEEVVVGLYWTINSIGILLSSQEFSN